MGICIWSSLYLDICMYIYGPHFTLRCECMYMVVTGIKYHYLNIPPNCMYIRYLCLGQATTRVDLALGVSEIRYIYIYIVKLVYNNHSRYQQKGAVMDRWPLYGGP